MYGTLGNRGFSGVAAIANTFVLSPLIDVEGATQVSCGITHACATANGTLLCWGFSNQGQVGGVRGIAVLYATRFPTGITETDTVMDMVAGGWNTCAILKNTKG